MRYLVLPDGRKLEIPSNPVPSRAQTRKQSERPRYGWESERQKQSLAAPGGRFWYHAVIDPRTKQSSPTGCIVVDEVLMFRNVGPGFPKTDSVTEL